MVLVAAAGALGAVVPCWVCAVWVSAATAVVENRSAAARDTRGGFMGRRKRFQVP